MDSNGRNDVGEDVVVEMGVDAGMAEEREVDQVREGDVVLDMGEMVMSSIGSISQEPFQPEDQPELVSPFQGQPDENNLQDQYDTGLPASVSTLASADIMPTQTFTRSLTRPYRESGLRNVSRREDSDDGPEHTEDDGEAAIPIHASRRTLKTNRRKSMLKDWKFSIRKGAEYTTDENELHLLHSPTPLKSSPAASSNLHPYATHLYEHRRLSYSTTLAPSHISIPIAHTPRPVLLHMPSPFVTFRKLYYRLITKGAHNGDAFHTDMNNLPAEVKQREAFTQDDILGAVARGSLEEVRRVKKETGWIDGRHVLDSRGPEGETLLHVALLMNSEKHDEIAEYLVAKRPNLVNAVYEGANFTGEHCCHLLAVQNKLHMLKWFIKHGADVHNARATGKFFRPSGTLYFGETVLAFAACMGHFDIVRYLTEKVGIDPNTIDHQGNNILHVLAFWGYYNDTRARHPDREDYRTKSHSTLGGIYLYLRDAGADDTLANGVGMTPLQVAVARGHTEMVNAMMNTRRETLWVYGKASAFLYDLSEVDTFVDPVTMGHAKGALEIAIKQKNRDVLNLPLFQRILEAKWISYGRAMFTFNVFRSISYYILFTAVIYLVPNGSDYYRADLPDSSRTAYLHDGPTGHARLFLESLLLFCNGVTFLEELGQVKRLGKDYFWDRARERVRCSGLIWCLWGVLCWRGWFRDRILRMCCWGCMLFLGWISLLNLTVGNRSMGTLWIIFIKVVTGDLLRFLLLMLVFILGFGEALWLQMAPYANFYNDVNANMTAEERAESFDNGKADWKDLPLAFVWSFRILMQQGVYDDFRRPVNNWLSILLFMVLFFILMILLLNVFLAMLNQTFSKIMEDTEKQWRVTWAQLILTYDEALLSEYYEKLRHGRNPSFPISRIGFPRKSDNFLNDERQTALLEKRLGYKAIPFIKRLFGYLRHSFVHHSTFYHYCIIFEFREDSELPIRMIASADVNSPLSGKWQVSSLSEKPWDKALLESLENGKIEPPVKRNARKKGPSYPRNKSRGRYEMERTVKGKGVGEDIV